MRIFFATDLHGSLVCFRKFLAARKFYSADVLILGGDLTGKAIVPILRNGDTSSFELFGKPFVVRSANELAEAEQSIRNVGFYPLHLSADQIKSVTKEFLAEKLTELVRLQIQEWERMARSYGDMVFLVPGNDDIVEVDRVLQECTSLINCDHKVIEIGNGYTVAGLGGSNQTPWRTVREYTEEQLADGLDSLMGAVPDIEHCIANIHVPPFRSNLDVCEAIDERYRIITRMGNAELRPVGSTAVDYAIRSWQPLLALFGHVHESLGWVKIGRTLCINPGSEYYVGVLNGCLVEFDDAGIRSFQLTKG